MPKLATPKLTSDWNGDPDPILDAAQVATELIEAAGITPLTTTIQIDWGEGGAAENSIKEAREALLFAQRPQGIQIDLFHPGGNGIEHFAVVGMQQVLLVRAKGSDFALTNQVFDKAKEILQSRAVAHEPGVGAIVQGAIEVKTSTVEAPKQQAHGRSVEWIESHVGLITLTIGVIGIIAAIVIAIVSAA